MTIATDFPDFDLATLPAIPAGFVDISWRNDACPRFDNEALALYLWIDFLDPTEREFPDTNRFLLGDYDGAEIIATDDFSEIVAAIESRCKHQDTGRGVCAHCGKPL